MSYLLERFPGEEVLEILRNACPFSDRHLVYGAFENGPRRVKKGSVIVIYPRQDGGFYLSVFHVRGSRRQLGYDLVSFNPRGELEEYSELMSPTETLPGKPSATKENIPKPIPPSEERILFGPHADGIDGDAVEAQSRAADLLNLLMNATPISRGDINHPVDRGWIWEPCQTSFDLPKSE